MADWEEIQAGHAQRRGKGRERNWKDEKIEILIMLYEEKSCHWYVDFLRLIGRNVYSGFVGKNVCSHRNFLCFPSKLRRLERVFWPRGE